jgi:hypothetical protein
MRRLVADILTDEFDDVTQLVRFSLKAA